MKRNLALFTLLLFFQFSYSQTDTIKLATPEKSDYPEPKKTIREGPVYKLNKPVDWPIIIAGTGWSLYAFTVIYQKPNSTVQQIIDLDTNDIPSFDRWAIYPYSDSLSHLSAFLFYGSMPVPLVAFLFTEEMRRDYGRLAFLYWEVMAVTGLPGTGAPYFIDRYRPYVYDPNTPMVKRLDGIAKNSAFSGHVEIVAASLFFTAKVFNDYYPESKWFAYSIAGVGTAAMGYWRIKGGEHFPSDVFVGATLGTLAGILVPHFHKQRSDGGMSVLPLINKDIKGFTLTYKLK